MSTLDIRGDDASPVNVIRIADSDEYVTVADCLYRDHHGDVYVKDSAECADDLEIKNKAHALHMIKGIEKAIELGWFN